MLKRLHPEYFKNLVFGIEDSVVSTVGVLFGLATAAMDRSTIFTTGLIVISVEAISMGIGSYLSEESTQEIDGQKHKDKPAIEGIIMFCSYYFAGFVPLIPYIFFDIVSAKYVSVIVALFTLFLVGFIPSKKAKSGLKMAVLAGFAIFIGFTVGKFLKL
jgi:VIT1/CCC1 family predicted Fe2+/Mn2+ transporter